MEDGVRVFRVDLLVDNSSYKKFAEFSKFFKLIHPQSLEASLELSQSPSQQDPKLPLDFKLSVKGEMLKSSLELVRELLGLDTRDNTSDEDDTSEGTNWVFLELS